MDLTKDTIYEQLNSLEFKESNYSDYEFNDLFHAIAESSILISISDNKTIFLKNLYGKTGELGTSDLLNVLMGFLYDSLDCDVKLFKESFLKELDVYLTNVLTRHGIHISSEEVSPDES